jgi:competence protein ComEA
MDTGTMSLEVPKRASRPAQGGRPAPLLSGIWGPVIAKGAIALGAVAVLAFVGARAGANPPAIAVAVAGAGAASAAPAAATAAVLPVVEAPAVPGTEPASADGGATISPGILPDGRVVLNAADEEALKTLPGIGPKRAQAILALRHRLARFRAVEDLLRVKGIGKKTLSKIKPKVVLNGPG